MLRYLSFGLLFFWTSLALAQPAQIQLGSWDEPRLDQLLADAAMITEPGARIVFLSDGLVDTPYQGQTLTAGPDQPEQLVVNLACFDCFTLLDMVETLRRSTSAAEIPEQLRRVRYRQGQISFTSRRHFFSDWVTEAESPIIDVTGLVGGERSRTRVKQLNRKAEDQLWIPTLEVVSRPITYIPAGLVNDVILARLQSGDYVGIFSPVDGLDVSHTGLLVRRSGELLLRHASSRQETQRVVDEEFRSYLEGTPGIVVYRVR